MAYFDPCLLWTYLIPKKIVGKVNVKVVEKKICQQENEEPHISGPFMVQRYATLVKSC